MGNLSFIPAGAGFMIGIGFLSLSDEVTPHMRMDQRNEGPKSALKRKKSASSAPFFKVSSAMAEYKEYPLSVFQAELSNNASPRPRTPSYATFSTDYAEAVTNIFARAASNGEAAVPK